MKRRPRASGLDLVVFFRSLTTLQSAAVPLMSCFHSLGESVENVTLKDFCEHAAGQLSKGHNISSCLQSCPQVFSAFHVHLTSVGEETGTLAQVLGYIATFEESRERLAQKVRSALIYPTMVGLVALLGLTFVLPYVLGGVFEFIKESGAQPPLLTRLVMSVSSFLSSPLGWLAVILVLGSGYLALQRVAASAKWRVTLLSLPGLGNCLRCAGSARFAGALSLCLKSGLNIQRALVLAARATGDPLLSERIKAVREAVEEGATISEALSRIDYFTPLFLEIVSSGEEVGRIDEMLDWLSESLERDLEQDLQTYAGLLEPIMLLLVGFIVGVIVIATATPMLNLIQTLG